MPAIKCACFLPGILGAPYPTHKDIFVFEDGVSDHEELLHIEVQLVICNIPSFVNGLDMSQTHLIPMTTAFTCPEGFPL